MTEMGDRFTADSQRADRFHQADSRGGLPVDLISPLQGITWRFTQFASGCDCQSGVWREPESVQIQSGEAYTLNCSSYWVSAAQSICYGYPHIDIAFEQPMADIPRIIVSDKSLFPFTPCAAGAADAIDHIVTNVTRFGFRLLGGASPVSNSGCGAAASNSRAVSLFSWLAITKK